MFSLVAPVKRGKAIHMWFFSLPTSPYWQPSPSICHPHLPALYLSLLVPPISFVVFPCPKARLFHRLCFLSNCMCDAISRITSKFPNSPLCIAGDTNLPDVDWQTITVSKHQYTKQINELFIDTFAMLG